MQGNVTVVTLDSRFSDYDPKPVMEDGRMVMKTVEKTIKDCRAIDGCVYLHLGRATDAEMVRLIQIFQKLKQEKGWKEEIEPIVPDAKFIF